jgi:hypothetical protein
MPGLLSTVPELLELPPAAYTRWRWNATQIECDLCRGNRLVHSVAIILANGHCMELHLREEHYGYGMYTYWRDHVTRDPPAIFP